MFFIICLLFCLVNSCISQELITVSVDPNEGDDNQCMSAIDLTLFGLTSWDRPCRTLNYAILGNKNLTIRANNCTENSLNLTNIKILLSDGIHQLTNRLLIIGSDNITIEPEAGAVPIIRCVTFPNYQIGNFDNIFVCEVDGLQFSGVIFEGCGPVPSNVFIYGCSNIEFNGCIFRNNSGAGLQFRFTDSINIINTVFEYNRNNATATFDDNETTIEDLYGIVQTSGGITIFTQKHSAKVLIDNCTFQHNEASRNLNNDTRPVLLKQNGHGGSILIRLSGTVNAEFTISNSRFYGNRAQIDGGAVYVSYSDGSDSNTFRFINNQFDSNIVDDAAGGAISINSFNYTYNNTFIIESCDFSNNEGSAGGGVSMALYDSDLSSTERPDEMQFSKCNFSCNKAINEGTGVGLFSLVHVDQVGFPVKFHNCIFTNNTSIDLKNQDTSAIAAFRFPTEFTGENLFIGNIGGGIMLLNTRMSAEGTMLFDSNVAVFGGGIMMDDRCLLEVHPGVNMTFINNYAAESGGGIYVEFPPIRFVIDIFNRLCFLQYNDNSGNDIPPQKWEEVSISFINNTARLSGAAIYASDMQRCSWLGNDYTDMEDLLIFRFPPSINETQPFHYEGNSLEVEGLESNVEDPELATAPLRINPTVKYSLVQPGEKLAITIYATDQLNNSREAVWALEAPNQDTTLDALSANSDTYFYDVPDTNNTLSLHFSLLKTLGFTSSLELEVHSCHPGYTKDEDEDERLCICDTSKDEILRCDDDNRYIYLREGIWGGVRDDDNETLIVARVLPGYINCEQQGRLPGCLFQFDNSDIQCTTGRQGPLCGQCQDDYIVTMDLQRCSEANDCTTGLVLFILFSCVGVFIICFLILWFNVPIPNELKAFIFYIQVIGLVYRPYSVVKKSSGDIDEIAVILNVLGFSNPIPFCIAKGVGAEYIALLGYIPPLIIFTTIIGFIIGARFIKQFARHSALKGITTLSIFVYKYIADTSFIFLSCVQTDLGFVFQYDGSVQCWTPYFGFFFVLALLTVILFVAPLPFFVSFVCFKRPQYFQAYSDALTDGLKSKHRWWGGWDVGRRLPFVVISFFVVLFRPSLVLFFMSLAALVVLIVHLFVKPYEKEAINIIEAILLLDLLMITGAFLDPSSDQVPAAFAYILVFLPYAYCVGYICWKIGIYVMHKAKTKMVIQQNEEITLPEFGQNGEEERSTDEKTQDRENSGDSQVTQPPDKDDVENNVKLREPLLDDL